jgi:ribosomal protein L29
LLGGHREGSVPPRTPQAAHQDGARSPWRCPVSKSSANLQNLRDQTDEELRTALATTRDELFRLQLGQYTNQVTSTALLTTKRRDIARILTLLNGRKLGTETQSGKAEAAPAAAEEAPAKKTKADKAEKKSKKAKAES